MKGPASHVSENGQFTNGLITPAETVSDKLDTHLCPDKIRVRITHDNNFSLQKAAFSR